VWHRTSNCVGRFLRLEGRVVVGREERNANAAQMTGDGERAAQAVASREQTRSESERDATGAASVVRHTPLGLIGMGVLYGWAWLAFLSPNTLFYQDQQYVAVVRASWTVAITVNLVIWFLLLAVRRSRSISLVENRWLTVSLAILVPIGTLGASLITGAQPLHWGLQLFCIGLAALGSTFFPLLWLEICGRLDTRRASLGTAVSALTAVGLYFGVLALPTAAAQIVSTSLLPVVCILLLHSTVRRLARDHSTPVAETELGAPEVPVSKTLAFVPGGLGLAYGLMLGAIDFLTGSQSSALYSVLIGGFGTLLMLVAAAVFARRLDFFQFVYRAVVPLVAAGLVLLPLGTTMMAAAVVLGGFLVFDIVANSQISEVARRLGIPALRLGVYSRAVSHGGIFVGMLLGRLVAGNGFMTGTQLIVASMLLLWMLVVALTYTLRSDSVRENKAAEPENVCRGLATKYGLSAREEEVLDLLIQGRSLPYIQRELYISLSTAKFHVSNIYTKFDVHTRQDLLDTVAQSKACDTSNGAHIEPPAKPRLDARTVTSAPAAAQSSGKACTRESDRRSNGSHKDCAL